MEESEPREQDWAAFLIDMPRRRAATGWASVSSRTAVPRRDGFRADHRSGAKWLSAWRSGDGKINEGSE
jgi:hypothetical protein